MYNSVSRCSALKIKLSPYACMLSCVQLCDPMDCSPPGPLSMGFSRWEYLNGQSFPPPDDLPDAGIKPMSPAYISQIAGTFFTTIVVQNVPAMRETWVQSLGWEDLLEKGNTTHSSILAWRISWTLKELDTTEQLSLHFTSLPPLERE